MSEIRMFPNSGHHYEFFAIPEEALRAHADVQKACVQDNQPWRVHPAAKWLRYRLGTSEQNGKSVAGCWVAFESNLGTAERGIVLQPRTPVTHRLVPEGYSAFQTPYAYHDEREIGPEGSASLKLPIHNPKTGAHAFDLPLPAILWSQAAAEPLDVDLIVDFGNTRTVALVLEHDRSGRLRDMCLPLRFVRRGTNYEPFTAVGVSEDPCSIVDSWIVLQEPIFADYAPPAESFQPTVVLHVEDREKRGWLGMGRGEATQTVTAETHYLPQTFVELAPVLLGGGNGKDGARQVLNDAKLEDEANFFVSSPKRYAWDNRQVGVGGDQLWHVALNRWSGINGRDSRRGLPVLQGPILMLMDTDGRHWDISEPPNERSEVARRPHASDHPVHPRRDTLTWAALGILEAAYRQISSQQYRRAAGRPFVPRRLSSVVVTFPAGWTTEELTAYRQQWQKAINIFTVGHLRDRRLATAVNRAERGERPELITDLNEAVASQLPIIFSEIEGMAGARGGENWIELMGRGTGTDARVRVLNVDIGGGTTDVAVVEYRDDLPGQQVGLNATLLFKNGGGVAGDLVVKRVIEQILLPGISAGIANTEKLRQKFAALFRLTPREWLVREPGYRRRLSRIVRLVFIPIVNHWLRQLTGGELQRPDHWNKPLRDLRDAERQQLVSQPLVDEFNHLVRTFVFEEAKDARSRGRDALAWDQPVNCDVPALRRCVSEVFEGLFKVLGRVTAGFDCDLALVSGKPSELPEVRELLFAALPLARSRIIFSHGYPVGEWYPIGASDGRIQDAKTPTVVGAALAQAMRTDKLPNWRLDTHNQLMLTENYWGLMPPEDRPEGFGSDLLLGPGQNEWTGTLLIGNRIGRKWQNVPELAFEQIYVLRWRTSRPADSPKLTVTLRRVRQAEDETEKLELAEVIGTDRAGKPVTLADVELQLCTLNGEFWMDDPAFDVVHAGV